MDAPTTRKQPFVRRHAPAILLAATFVSLAIVAAWLASTAMFAQLAAAAVAASLALAAVRRVAGRRRERGGPPATHYDVLGLPPRASAKQIRVAYRERAPRAASRREADALARAHGVLTDPHRRQRYDDDLADEERQRAA